MRISHEVPLCLLEDSLKFNDYQYVLPHYWIKYPQYREFMLQYRQQENSFIILDNGLFEGGVFDDETLVSLIHLLRPNIFVVPDAWDNYFRTLDLATKWKKEIEPHLPPHTRLMIVLQGTNIWQLESLYVLAHSIGYTYFGFNHSSKAYEQLHPHYLPHISKSMGRIKAIDRLEAKKIIDELSYHHLLGINSPIELELMSRKSYIRSIDTSNPVLWGAKGVKYYDGMYNLSKPTEKIEEFMEKDLSSQKEDIMLNVNKFREILTK